MISADLILENLRATSKKQVLELIAEKAAGLFFGNPDTVLGALIERERLGSTGIGAGVAIPHIKIPSLKRMYGVLACLSTPVDYGAIDGQPVDLIFLLLAPSESKTTEHLKALSQVSRFLKDAETCCRLRGTRDHAAIAAVIDEWLKRQAA
jgi:PTS system nitrogen regulatory IIA component